MRFKIFILLETYFFDDIKFIKDYNSYVFIFSSKSRNIVCGKLYNANALENKLTIVYFT